MNNHDNNLTKTELVSKYHRSITLKLIVLAICILGIVLFVGLFSLSAYNGITLKEAYEIIWNHILGNEYEKRTLYWWADRYIWNTAMPHIIAAIIAGASLASCGVLMQSLMVNPLADPYSTGISSGACFGAVSAIVMGVSFSTVSSELGIVVNAFFGALIPAIIIIVLSEKIQIGRASCRERV